MEKFLNLRVGLQGFYQRKLTVYQPGAITLISGSRKHHLVDCLHNKTHSIHVTGATSKSTN